MLLVLLKLICAFLFFYPFPIYLFCQGNKGKKNEPKRVSLSSFHCLLCLFSFLLSQREATPLGNGKRSKAKKQSMSLAFLLPKV